MNKKNRTTPLWRALMAGIAILLAMSACGPDDQPAPAAPAETEAATDPYCYSFSLETGETVAVQLYRSSLTMTEQVVSCPQPETLGSGPSETALSYAEMLCTTTGNTISVWIDKGWISCDDLVPPAPAATEAPAAACPANGFVPYDSTKFDGWFVNGGTPMDDAISIFHISVAKSSNLGISRTNNGKTEIAIANFQTCPDGSLHTDWVGGQ